MAHSHIMSNYVKTKIHYYTFEENFPNSEMFLPAKRAASLTFYELEHVNTIYLHCSIS